MQYRLLSKLVRSRYLKFCSTWAELFFRKRLKFAIYNSEYSERTFLHGKQYFPFIDTVKPHFSKKAPENKWEFFSAASDEDFKKLHPVGYKVLAIIGIVALMIPIIIYIAYVFFINPPMAGDVSITIMDFIIAMLGFSGAFVVGVGLFNVVAAWIHQYLGHLLTAVCLLGGTALTLFSMYLLYT